MNLQFANAIWLYCYLLIIFIVSLLNIAQARCGRERERFVRLEMLMFWERKIAMEWARAIRASAIDCCQNIGCLNGNCFMFMQKIILWSIICSFRLSNGLVINELKGGIREFQISLQLSEKKNVCNSFMATVISRIHSCSRACLCGTCAASLQLLFTSANNRNTGFAINTKKNN